MATVSSSDIMNTLPVFIRDVLRENLVDTQSPARAGNQWIFKGSTEEEFNPPIVFIDDIDVDEETFDLAKTKRTYRSITLLIRVWATKLVDRDNLVNQIRNVLSDYSKTDGANSILSQHLVLLSFSHRMRDAISSKYNEPVNIKRIAEITTEWGYFGG